MATTEPMTEEELLALPVTVKVETAGRAWGWGKTKSNDLARAGEFPVKILTHGRRKVVTKASLLMALGYEWDGATGKWRAGSGTPVAPEAPADAA